jgi:chromosome segregation ATPase
MNETGLVAPGGLVVPDSLVDPLNPPSGFPSMTPLGGSGGWFAGLSKAAGGLFSVAKNVGGRLVGGAAGVACTAGRLVAAHPVGVGVAVAAAVVGGAAYYGYRYVNGLKAEIARQQGIIDEQADTIDGHIAQIEKLNETIAKQGLTIKDLRGKLQTATDQIKHANTQIRQLSSDLKTERGRVATLTQEKTALAHEGHGLQAEINRLKGQLATAQGQARTDQRKIATLQSKISDLEARYAQVENNWNQANAEKRAALETVANLKGQLQAKDAEITKIRADCAAQVKEMDSVCRAKIDSLNEAQAQASETKKREYEQEIARVRTECAAQIEGFVVQLEGVYAQRAQADAHGDILFANMRAAQCGIAAYRPPSFA